MLRHPCILGGPKRQARGAKSEVVPNKGEQNQKIIASSLSSQGSKRRGTCYSTPAFAGVPNAKRGEKSEGLILEKLFDIFFISFITVA